jgi:hypothetical protein
MFKIVARVSPKIVTMNIRKTHGISSECTLFQQKIDHIIASRKRLKSPQEMAIEFSNAKRIDHEKKVTEYWNFFADELIKHKSGQFLIKHPSDDIVDEIMQIASNFGYTVEFDLPNVTGRCYVIINDGKI